MHEIASRLGMDVRDVAARLAVLSTTGLPMVVGVECDPVGIRNAVAAANAWTQASGGYQVPNPPSGGYQVPNPPSGGHQVHGGPSGAHSGGHPGQSQAGGAQPFTPAGPPASLGQPQQARPAPAPGPQQAPQNTWGPPGSAAWARGDQQQLSLIHI